MCLSQMAKRRAMEWLPNHSFPWNLLGRQIVGTGAKDSSLCHHNRLENLSSLLSAASCYLFNTWGRWSVGCYSGYSSLQKNLNLFTDCQNPNRTEKYRRKKKRLWGEPLPGPVTAIYVSIWPKPGVCNGTQSWHSDDKNCLGSDLS